MYIYVYHIRNIINNKEYIGVHKTQNMDDGYMGSGVAIKRAIQKYGNHNFIKTIISFFDSEIEAYSYESNHVNEEYIKNKMTYNMTVGGNKPPSRKGIKYDEQALAKCKIIANTPERKAASSRGGKTAIQRVKDFGWSADSLKRRTETNRKIGFSKDMSACHTVESIEKRNKTRKLNGVAYKVQQLYTEEVLRQKMKTKYYKLLITLAKKYNEPLTLDLINLAKKRRETYITISTLLNYFTEEEIRQIPYGAPQLIPT